MNLRIFFTLSILFTLSLPHLHAQRTWTADNGDGTFTNPLLWGDWPDPDIIRVGKKFYYCCPVKLKRARQPCPKPSKIRLRTSFFQK